MLDAVNVYLMMVVPLIYFVSVCNANTTNLLHDIQPASTVVMGTTVEISTDRTS